MNRKTTLTSPGMFWLLLALILGLSGSGPLSAQHSEDANHKHTNKLVDETSPYLLMHAHNPVYWYPWNEETLALAKKENKPIFLSIGYSSCHWCHVMERESFMDEEIAKFLNEHFICIKVDREERPDVDAIYMESLQMIHRITRSNRGGGWPLSMFLTSDAKPFSGGTYFPARDGDRGARFGFLSIIKKIDDSWKNLNERVQQDADLITTLTQRSLAGRPVPEDATINPSWQTFAKDELKSSFDPYYGGFRFSEQNPQIPKFPEPSNLFFLIDLVRDNPTDAAAKNMLVTTCQQMMMGGIYDHLGGGFHRYSVDRYWAIPHFEKMLYDNGQLATVYSELFEITNDVQFRWVVEGICDFVLAELLDKSGGFYSALDAESEGEEGKFNRWDLPEIKATLSEKEYALFANIYRLNEPPNFEEKHYVPQLKKTLEAWAAQRQQSVDELNQQLLPIRKKLFDVREKRVRPLTDTKILTSWNGLMIRGLADAGRILKNERYLQASARAADFIVEKMMTKEGRLLRTFTAGQAKLNAYLEDYACAIDGFLALHRATKDQKWLDLAEKLQEKQNELFWDDKAGGYFYTSKDHEVLIARSKKLVDSAMPSGNSVSAGNLHYLWSVTRKSDYKERATKCVLTAKIMIDQIATICPRLLITAKKLSQ